MVERIKVFAYKWKYEAVIFLATMIPVLLNIDKLSEIHHMFVLHYLPDFSMGINSRVLVGSVVKLLNPNPTEEWLTNFAIVFLILGMILTSIVLGKVVKKSTSENKLSVWVFILFFVSGAYTISLFSRFFGMLDIHMYILAILAVVFAGNKYLRWLVPVLCVAGVFVNYVFTISYFIIVLLAMLYYADKNEKKACDIAVFVITVISVVALTAYFVFEAHNHMFMTYEDALMLVEGKIGHSFTEEQKEYLLIYLFRVHPESAKLYGVEIKDASPMQFIYIFIKFILENRTGSGGRFSLALVTIPVILVFSIIWIMCIKNTEKKGKKFVYLCAILSFLFIPLCCLLSTDYIRWIGAVVMCQYAMCFLMFYVRDEAFDKTVGKLRAIFSENKIILIIIYLVYLSSAYVSLVT